MELFHSAKRGQVTVFIIIGIVVVFAASIVLLLSSELSKEDPELVPTLDTIPSQAQPYRDYVEDCVNGLIQQATHLISYQGGYIETQPFANRDIDPDNPTVFYSTGVPIPYWYYTDKNQEEAFQMPALRGNDPLSIESQISSFVNENLDDCIGSFEPFQQTGFLVERMRSVPQTQTYITDDGVTSIVTYPLEVQSQGTQNEFRIEKYRADYDINLKRTYELARDILIYEAATAFLEKTAINGLTERMSEDPSEGIPPMYSFVEFEECIPKYWSVNQAEQAVEDVIGLHIPFLKIENTKFEEVTIGPQGDPDLQRFMQKAFTDFKISATGDQEYPTMEVGFQSTFGLDDFSINGQNGGVVTIDRIEGPIPQIGAIPGVPALCMNDYSFYYTFKSPTLMTIQDTTPNKELLFNVPIQLAIVQNRERTAHQPANDWLEPIQDYNDQLDTDVIDECNDEFKTSDTKTFEVIDAYTGDLIPFASVEYQCGILGDMCLIGATDERGLLRTPTSDCVSGVLKVSHPDYLGNATDLQLMDGGETEFTIELIPLKEVNLTLLSYSADVLRDDGMTQSSDMVQIQMQQRGLEESDLPYCSLTNPAAMAVNRGIAYGTYYKYNYETGIFPSTQVIWQSTQESNTIKVGPGRYHMHLQYMSGQPHTIPRGSTVIDQDGMDPILLPEEDVRLETVPLGGSVIDFEITKEMHQNPDVEELYVYVLDFNIPQSLPEVGYNGGDYVNCSSKFSEKLKPKLV